MGVHHQVGRGDDGGVLGDEIFAPAEQQHVSGANCAGSISIRWRCPACASASRREASAQSGAVSDDGFLSSSSATQQFNLNGQGIVLIVAGSSATVGSASVGTTKTYIKFRLLSSLPTTGAARSVAKATLKLYLSPGTNPSGAIDVYPATNSWTESTLGTVPISGINSCTASKVNPH